MSKANPGKKRSRLNRLHQQFDATCQICHQPCERREATREHVVRRADGGANYRNNIVLAHRSCNNVKGALDEMLRGCRDA